MRKLAALRQVRSRVGKSAQTSVFTFGDVSLLASNLLSRLTGMFDGEFYQLAKETLPIYGARYIQCQAR